MRRITAYIRDHWQGRHSLARAIWLNLVALRVAIFAAQEALTPALAATSLWLLVPLIVLVHGVVFVWQAVGTLRSADAHVSGSGQMFPVWGTQLTLIVTAFWVLSYSLEAWQSTLPDPLADLPSEADNTAAREARYALTITGDTLALTGTLELGATARVAELLDENPEITTVRLTSTGGNVFEARALSKLFRERGLTTHVTTECSSACTTAFIGGTTRLLAPDARLGFHAYRVEATYAVLGTDPSREQERDKALFRAVGVSEDFIGRMHESPAREMWFPAVKVLVGAGVVTRVGE